MAWGLGNEKKVTLKLPFLCGLGGGQIREERFLGNQVAEEKALHCTRPRGYRGLIALII